ncbi:hypothetical protein [Tenacibaculum mesophilum]|uniref:hypothetical protein n=1 Tax=Tenacibaculum mesophilum TaxID=104268 RepID=UPI00064A086C|nr:hypothetical protein [Tenacibaculum mesophilum]
MTNNLINLSEKDLNKNIYRIYPLFRILELLETKQNVLVKTEEWEDPFENFILKSTGKLPSGELFTVNSRNKYYGQCWSLKKESDAMWRIYSQHIKDSKTKELIIDNIGIKVKSTIRKIFEDLFETQENHINPYNKKPYNLFTFAGKVQYKKKQELVELLNNASDYLLDGTGKGQAETLMLKRLAFTHEKEVRFVFHNTNGKTTDKVFKYKINPNESFEEIVVDPRIPKETYLKIKEQLKEKGFENKIIQSGLYKIENFVFETDLK